jgi:hypothetical protein
MAPPTLEQVLTRSMRIPASRAARVLKRMTAVPLPAVAAQNVPSIFPPPPARAAASGVDGRAGPPTGSRAEADLRKEERQSREDEYVKPMRPTRNYSQDLATYLYAARSVGDWEGAAIAFAAAMHEDPTFVPTSAQTAALIGVVADEGMLEAVERPLMAALVDRSRSYHLRSDHHVSNGEAVEAPHDAPDPLAAAASAVEHVAAVVDARHAPPSPPASTASSTSEARISNVSIARTRRAVSATHEAAVHLMNCYASAEQWLPALRLLAQAKLASPDGFVPVETYNAALGACEHSDQWYQALRIYSDMAASPESKPNAVTYAMLLAVMESSGRPDEGRELSAQMPPQEADDVLASYSALVHTWSARHARRAMKRF